MLKLGYSLLDLFAIKNTILVSHSRTERLFHLCRKLRAPQNLQLDDRDGAKDIDDCELTVGL